MSLEDWLNKRWYPATDGGDSDGMQLPLLAPLELVFRHGSRWRKQRKQAKPLPVPVIVVGNITVGGAGKTPIVAELGRWLQERGRKPGIISRGYGGRAKHYPYNVTAQSHPLESGDEPLMLHLMTGLPVMVSPRRAEAAEALIAEHGCDVILSDDGLQHYELWRSLEICVVDGKRGLGNEHLLPRGPLRESVDRLAHVDMVVANGKPSELVLSQCGEQIDFAMELAPSRWHQFNLDQTSTLKLESGPEVGPCHGVAAIGNPQRFFNALRALGYTVMEMAFPDHHQYSQQELQLDGVTPVIMTMKDAVKCRDFWQSHWWAIEVQAQFPDLFYQRIHQHLENFSSNAADSSKAQ
ncbi:tetraacyldisaccharide 4'-kinase [Microbulbifer sp. CAU 1566]|uniref:tetraacyldisaccharide 4'-kinase n=1 Tax=Microbulbifer sp. CAU 1566 TaxID=2933269 RepID=UPI0020051630|nr:tetraacyldisaccharide 4'-kinase [Microbulbifer sp. CAU 1566]MCK7596699.1 tetraacyldisaccharide 4'-kinase [Microbulbifer sp. CAU 1566]